MSYTPHIYLVQGFRVKFTNLFEVEKVSMPPLCFHPILPETKKYCPDCGKSTEIRMYERIKSKIPNLKLDPDEWKLKFEDNLSLVRGKGDREDCEDYILGIVLADEEPLSPNTLLYKSSPYEKSEILKTIESLPINIPFELDSFGVYLIFSMF